jgi:hypothetical protein
MGDKMEDAAPVFFDAAGKVVKDHAAFQAARVVHPGILTATACLELHGIGQGGAVIFNIQVTVDPNTYPFLILEGSIGGDICQVPLTQWVITGGSFGPQLFIDAKRLPLVLDPTAIGPIGGDEGCAKTMRIIGTFQAPDSYAGTYGTEGSSFDFSHTTLFKGWHSCP